MRKFKLTNPNFKGEVNYEFDDDGNIALFKNASEANNKQVYYLLTRFPFHVDQMLKVAENSACVIEEIPPDLTFEGGFWPIIEEGYKRNKKRCQELYEKLSAEYKQKAIMQYKHYMAGCRRLNRTIADPDTYLRKEHYITDWRNQK